jgi:hypothetical protein
MARDNVFWATARGWCEFIYVHGLPLMSRCNHVHCMCCCVKCRHVYRAGSGSFYDQWLNPLPWFSNVEVYVFNVCNLTTFKVNLGNMMSWCECWHEVIDVCDEVVTYVGKWMLARSSGFHIMSIGSWMFAFVARTHSYLPVGHIWPFVIIGRMTSTEPGVLHVWDELHVHVYQIGV